MPMGDDLATHSLELTTNASKMALEVLRYLSDLMQRLGNRSKGTFAKDDDNKIYRGSLNDKKFMEVASKSGGFKQQGNISRDDIPAIIKEAKIMGFPINVRTTGNGQCSVCYLDRDSDLFQGCMQNVVANKLAVKDTDYLSFGVKNHEISALQAAFAEQGISASFVETHDGSLNCVYEARDKSVVERIKADYHEKHAAIAEKLNITYDTEKRAFQLSDSTEGKSVTLNRLPTEAKLDTILQERFGYDKTSSALACVKFEGLLDDQQKKFFKTDTRQLEKISNYERNIKFEKENPLLADFSFARIKARADNHNHFAVSNGDHVIHLTPDSMSRRDMEEIVKSKLGISDRAAIEAIVDKATRANTKYKEQDKQIKKDLTKAAGVGEIYGIERTTVDSFDLTRDGNTKTYSLQNAREQLIADGLSAQKANEIVSKARRQSAAVNMFRNLEKQGLIKNEKSPEIKLPKVELPKPKAGAR